MDTPFKLQRNTGDATNLICLGAQFSQFMQDMGSVLEFNQGIQLLVNVLPIELRTLPDKNAFNINPIFAARRKGFHDNEVFRGASANEDAARKCEEAGAPDSGFFKWQAAQGNVEADARGSLQKKNPVAQREQFSVWNARLKMLEKCSDERFFTAKACQKGKIDINSFTRFAPALKRQPADKTKAPAICGASLSKQGDC